MGPSTTLVDLYDLLGEGCLLPSQLGERPIFSVVVASRSLRPKHLHSTERGWVAISASMSL